jgi:hypothetical protein
MFNSSLSFDFVWDQLTFVHFPTYFTIAMILGSRIVITGNELELVFKKILNGLQFSMPLQGIRRIHVLLTGPLGECPYVNEWYKESLQGFRYSEVKFLNTGDE